MVEPTVGSEFIVREDLEGVAVLTINRPEAHNVMNREIVASAQEHLETLIDDSTVDVVVFTGEGSESFVGGADIRELAIRGHEDGLRGVMQKLYERVANLVQPTIAAVNGYAFGGGHELALACDIRIASTNAEFALPETGLGIIPSAGGTQRLAKLIGEGRAIEAILTGRRIGSKEALRVGLITDLVESDRLMEVAHQTAQRIRAKGPLATRVGKEIMKHGFDSDHQTGLLLERLGQALLYSSDEKVEGTSAFLEKRRPDFRVGESGRQGPRFEG